MRRLPLLPELRLDLADESARLFADGYRSDRPPPFWAFAWAGGQALARYVLDHPETVRGREVLDVAAGGGVVAVAAARAGAARVVAVDADPAAAAAARRNAAANGVSVFTRTADVTAVTPAADTVVLVGDAFYSAGVARPMAALLRRSRDAGAAALVGDPGRGHLPQRLLAPVARYEVPVPRALEDTGTLVTTVWRVCPAARSS